MATSSTFRLRWGTSCILLLCAAGFSAASAQSPAGEQASGVQILQIKWEKQTRLPRNFDPSVVPTGVIFSEPESQTIRPGTSAATTASRAVTIAQTNPSTQENGTFGNAPGRLLLVYVYSMKIKNIGPKPIEGIAWDYVFLDSVSNVEVGRHQILSLTKVAAEKTTTVEAALRVPPIRTIQVQSAKSQKQEKFLERAVIQCVLYADQATWRNAQAPEGVCDLLKKAKAGLIRQAQGKP